jgi:hypothetical protein
VGGVPHSSFPLSTTAERGARGTSETGRRGIEIGEVRAAGGDVKEILSSYEKCRERSEQMAKFFGVILALGAAAGISLLILQEIPDIQRYLRIRAM